MTFTEYDCWLRSIRVVPSNFRLRVGQHIVFVSENRTTAPDGYYQYRPELLDGVVTEIMRENFQNTSYRVRLLDGSIIEVERYQIVEVIH